MIYFYARVSTRDQNLDRQLEVAKNYKNIDKVFCDKQSGKNFDRPEYVKLKKIVTAGDEVVVKELDRLGRNKEGIKDEIKWFRENGVVLRILDVPTTLIDFNGQDWIADMVNNILIEVLGAVAQQEREKNRQRQQEGILVMPIKNGKKVSAKTGNSYGRQAKCSDEDFMGVYRSYENSDKTIMDCCDELRISRSTWYNNVRRLVQNG